MIQSHPEIESLMFEITSSKSAFTVSSLAKSMETVFEGWPPELKYCTDFEVRVLGISGADEPTAEIGFLSGTSMEAEATFTDVGSFLVLCDMVSTDLYQMAMTDEAGHVKKSICPPERNIMYIHNMYVEDEYRGAGIGRYLLDNINDLFSRSLNYSHHVCILKPYPQVKFGDYYLRDKESATPQEVDQLTAFYKRVGYKYIRGSDYMYKIQTDALIQMLGL